jgi:hypothetical protein
VHLLRTTYRVGLLFAIISGLAIVAAPAALARPIICNAGTVKYTITSSSKTILETHGFGYATLGPGGSASRTISSTTSFTAGITVSTSASASAGIIFAKAEASVGFSLQASGTRTSTTSWTTSQSNNTGGLHRYVWFEGTKKGTGNWKSQRCGSDGTVWLNYNSGTWGSWNAQITGVLRCDQDGVVQDKFGTFSVEYKSVTTCS